VLNPLTLKEAHEYHEARLEGTGASHDLFSRRALRMILKEARGVPRSINVLCHNALLFAYGDGLVQVGAKHAKTSIQERRGGRLKRFDPKPSRRWLHRAMLVAAGGLAGVLVGVAFFGRLESSSAPAPSESRPVERAIVSPPLPSAADPDASEARQQVGETPANDGAAVTAEVSGEASPTAPRTIVVERGSSLYLLIVETYGGYDTELLQRVLAANPGIADPGIILPGQQVVLPEIPGA
jgi:phage tail protein X